MRYSAHNGDMFCSHFRGETKGKEPRKGTDYDVDVAGLLIRRGDIIGQPRDVIKE
jgi:hypothetical protein